MCVLRARKRRRSVMARVAEKFLKWQFQLTK
uniref:Uncharacterized protein n=1 Tax=Arundo donax TaxID=35708 RepID=A0A0A9HMZ0_ARUDO